MKKNWFRESSSSSSDDDRHGTHSSHPLALTGRRTAGASASVSIAARGGSSTRQHADPAAASAASDDDDDGIPHVTPLQVSRRHAAANHRPSLSPVRGAGKLSPRAAMMAGALAAPQQPMPQQQPGAAASSSSGGSMSGGKTRAASTAPSSGTASSSSAGATVPPSPASAASTANAAALAGSFAVTGGGAAMALSPPAGAGLLKSKIVMEFGDEYHGEAMRLDATTRGDSACIPHGRGTLQSPLGKHCYVGEFERRLRDGLGKLVTERFVLWARWKANRPDLTTSARVDYCNGDKYAGYLDMGQDPAATNALLKQHPQTLSNFSIWVQTAAVTRERWGEAVLTSSGSRYFGQWERNVPQGFGCYFGPSGDRYIGMFAQGKFNGSGTLFTALHTTTSTTAGLSLVELGVAWQSTPSSSGAPPVVPPMQAGGTVYDGVWEHGLFAGEDGHVIFPCHTRVTADWLNACHGQRGQVVFSHCVLPNSGDDRPKFIATFQWEPLLMSTKETGGSSKMEPQAAKQLRDSVMSAKSRALVEEVIRKTVKTTPVVVNACKIYRRCFFFLYGTCGNLSDIGSGGATPTATGWCHARHAYGGCIHPGRGKRIDASDTVAALGDIHSFVGTVKRWLYDAMGQAAVDRIVGELDAEHAVSRALLDTVMLDVHAPLLNLYSQAYAREEVQLAYAVRRLVHTTLDDFGVSFGRNESEKLFDPYADAVRSVERLPDAPTLSAKLAVLTRWSKDIDVSTKLAQVKLQDEHLVRLASFMRERNASVMRPAKGGGGGSDTGSNPNVSFSSASPLSDRSHTEAYVDGPVSGGSPGLSANVVGHASNSMRQFAMSPPPSASLQSDEALANAIHRIADLQDTPEKSGGKCGDGTATNAFTKNLLQQAMQVESGSADDLLPIHQYVLCKASIGTLYANTKLLCDLSADDTFIDPTSQDSFCITTLQACVSIIPELFADVRDPQNVITSVSMYDKRVEDFMFSIRGREVFQLVVRVVPMLLDALSVFPFTSAQLAKSPTAKAEGGGGSVSPRTAGRVSPAGASLPRKQTAATVRLADLAPDAYALLADAAATSASRREHPVWAAIARALQCVLIDLIVGPSSGTPTADASAATDGATELLLFPAAPRSFMSSKDTATAAAAGNSGDGATEAPVLVGVSTLALKVPLQMHASVFRSAAVLVASFRT